MHLLLLILFANFSVDFRKFVSCSLVRKFWDKGIGPFTCKAYCSCNGSSHISLIFIARRIDFINIGYFQIVYQNGALFPKFAWSIHIKFLKSDTTVSTNFIIKALQIDISTFKRDSKEKEINFYVFDVIKHICYHVSLYTICNKIDINFLKYILLSIEVITLLFLDVAQ